MKRIAPVVVLLYFAALLALTWPVLAVAFWGTSTIPPAPSPSLRTGPGLA
jgi:hypothetical protein